MSVDLLDLIMSICTSTTEKKKLNSIFLLLFSSFLFNMNSDSVFKQNQINENINNNKKTKKKTIIVLLNTLIAPAMQYIIQDSRFRACYVYEQNLRKMSAKYIEAK